MSKECQIIKERMLSIYGAGCWMGYKLSTKNPYTFHHIHEARNGGKLVMSNGAILSRVAHNDLNRMEQRCKTKKYYEELNKLFKELNNTKCPPTRYYFKEVNGILLKADNIIGLSHAFCDLNPDFIMLEEFSLITHEYYPEIPEIDELIERVNKKHEEEDYRLDNYKVKSLYYGIKSKRR